MRKKKQRKDFNNKILYQLQVLKAVSYILKHLKHLKRENNINIIYINIINNIDLGPYHKCQSCVYKWQGSQTQENQTECNGVI